MSTQCSVPLVELSSAQLIEKNNLSRESGGTGSPAYLLYNELSYRQSSGCLTYLRNDFQPSGQPKGHPAWRLTIPLKPSRDAPGGGRESAAGLGYPRG